MATTAAPAVSVESLIPLPPAYSLLKQSEVVEGQLRELAGGVGIWPYPATTARLWAPCQTGTFADKDLTDDTENASFQPFGVYLPVACSSIDATEDELRSRVRAVFEAVESEAVERELATGEIQPGNPHFADANADVLNSGAATDTFPALSMLERAIAATGRRGVIHADPGVVSAWSTALESDGGRLRTIANDTLVISGDGYLGTRPAGEAASTVTSGWAYATGPILIRRSPIEVLFGIDHHVNDAVAIAERNYIATWDVQLQAAVLVDFA